MLPVQLHLSYSDAISAGCSSGCSDAAVPLRFRCFLFVKCQPPNSPICFASKDFLRHSTAMPAGCSPGCSDAVVVSLLLLFFICQTSTSTQPLLSSPLIFSPWTCNCNGNRSSCGPPSIDTTLYWHVLYWQPHLLWSPLQ